WIEARACESESGATTLSTLVREIGLRSSFSPSVTANAAAVQPRRASTTTVGRMRATGGKTLVGTGRGFWAWSSTQVGDECPCRKAEPGGDRSGRDRVVGAGEIDQLDAAQHQHGGEPEPQRVVGHLEREEARDQAARDRARRARALCVRGDAGVPDGA